MNILKLPTHIKRSLALATLSLGVASLSATAAADIAILDFVNTTGEEIDFVQEQFATTLQTELTKVTHEKLINRGKVRTTALYNDVPASELSDKSVALFLGDKLHADKVIVGEVYRQGRALVIDAKMFDVQRGKVIKKSKITVESRNIAQMYHQFDDLAAHFSNFSDAKNNHAPQPTQPPVVNTPNHPEPENSQHSFHITFKTDDLTAFTVDGLYVFPNEQGVLQLILTSGQHTIKAWKGFKHRQVIFSDVISLSGNQHYSGIWRNGTLFQPQHAQTPEVVVIEQPEIEEPIYETPDNGYDILTPRQFNNTLADIKQYNTDVGRYDKTLRLFNDRRLTSTQARTLVDLVLNDTIKLKIAKFLYANTIDKENYTLVLSSIKNAPARRNLLSYITENR
jgi:TolB-like protein